MNISAIAQPIDDLSAFITTTCREKMNIEIAGDVPAGASIEQAFGLDSISTYELILALEERYKRKVADADIPKIAKMTIAELHAYFVAA
ncbi:MAG: acyl carrier protein [Verrucomicrobia bacterium]|nr:acyl carrier protein [Verrucomicrobiota bacterium]